jgi:cytochrome oxidase Cu insertion factor (SCO1/SenC/PrrC family)
MASGPPAGPYRGSRPPSGVYAPDFTLRDYRGKVVRMASLRGQIVLTTFVDSACHEACPLILSRLSGGLQMLDGRTRPWVVALAITVNPGVDTTAHVRRFLGERGALGQVDYLIGSVRRLRPVWKAYGILPAVDTGDANVHSADVRVFDRRGEWVSTLHTGVDLTAANVAHDVRTALARSNGWPFTLRTHCGVLSAWIGGRVWLADPPLTDGSGNPPPGWPNPAARGTLRQLSQARAEFHSREGKVAHFVPAPAGARDPARGCE